MNFCLSLLFWTAAMTAVWGCADPMKQTTQQKDAFERLRGNPVTTVNSREQTEMLKEAARKWDKLRGKINEALSLPNKLGEMTVEEMQAVHKLHEYGADATGWKTPYERDDPRSILLRYQFNILTDPSPNICAVLSRQVGKSFAFGAKIAERSFKQPRCKETFTSPSERQSLMGLEKIKDFVLAFGLDIDGEETQRDGSNPQALVTATKISLSNKSEITAVPGLARTLRGGSGNLTIDEVDHLENAQEFMRAVVALVANEMTGRKMIAKITTPNGKDSESYKCFHDEDQRALHSLHRWNIWQCVLMGLKQDPERLYKLLKDPEGWAQEFLCEWLDGSNVLLPYELIQSCESIEASEVDTPEMLAQSKLRKIAGIDFGRVNDPTVMSLAVNGLGVSIVRNVTKLKGMSTPDQVRTLKPYLDLCEKIVVDYTGPGIGFGDELVELYGEFKPDDHKLTGKVELCTFTLPLKRDIFPSLRVAFEKRNIRVPISSWYREDLHAMAQVIQNGQYNYKAPRSDEGHSDGCTSLALMVRAASSVGCVYDFSTMSDILRGPNAAASEGDAFGVWSPEEMPLGAAPAHAHLFS